MFAVEACMINNLVDPKTYNVSLTSLRQKNKSVPVTSSNRYAVACSVVTFILTAAVVVAQLFPVTSIMFVGTKIEGVLTIVLVRDGDRTLGWMTCLS